MPSKLDAREVLSYLNELGYTNISSQQLKEFMQDLKKLIKYERKKHKENLQQSASTVPQSCDNTATTATNVPGEDPFTNLHLRQTVESKAKVVPKRDNVITVQIKQSRHSSTSCVHNKENIQPGSKTVVDKQATVLVEKDVQTDEIPTASPSKTGKTVDKSKSKKTVLKPKVAWIRSSMPVNTKSDPVALYHQYKAEWKKYKIPGEDNRADLRWAVREQMLGGTRLTRI